jgi:hypothetical protein
MSQQSLEMQNPTVEPTEAEIVAEPGGPDISISERELRDLAKVGLLVRDMESLDVMRGTIVIHQKLLQAAIDSLGGSITELGKKARKTRQDYSLMTNLSHSLARLGEQLNESQRLLLGIEKSTPEIEEDDLEPINTFTPRRRVKPAGEDTGNKG